MATAGELSAVITHEIKQPLTCIVTMANAALRWLSRDTPDISKARDAMNKVVAAGHHASDIITNVRGLLAKDTQETGPHRHQQTDQDSFRLGLYRPTEVQH